MRHDTQPNRNHFLLTNLVNGARRRLTREDPAMTRQLWPDTLAILKMDEEKLRPFAASLNEKVSWLQVDVAALDEEATRLARLLEQSRRREASLRTRRARAIGWRRRTRKYATKGPLGPASERWGAGTLPKG
jgi:hypothetical protein